MDLRPKRIDVYIVSKFITTFFVALLLIIGIVIIFDISEKIDNFVAKEAPLKAIVVDYYLNFIPYFMNMFSPLFVFITVIFFTSKMAADSEIIAILSCGISLPMSEPVHNSGRQQDEAGVREPICKDEIQERGKECPLSDISRRIRICRIFQFLEQYRIQVHIGKDC